MARSRSIAPRSNSCQSGCSKICSRISAAVAASGCNCAMKAGGSHSSSTPPTSKITFRIGVMPLVWRNWGLAPNPRKVQDLLFRGDEFHAEDDQRGAERTLEPNDHARALESARAARGDLRVGEQAVRVDHHGHAEHDAELRQQRAIRRDELWQERQH